MIDALLREADRPGCPDLSRFPAAICETVIAYERAMMAGRTGWELASAQATRLAAVLPAIRSDDAGKVVAIREIALALAAYPPGVALAAADQLMACQRFRPVPAEVHATCQAIRTRLNVAAGQAGRVLKGRADAEAARRAREAEAAEERRAMAEGRETPAQRRERLAAQAKAMIRGIWREDDGKELRSTAP